MRRLRESRIQKLCELGVRKVPRAIIGTLILVGIGINFANVVARYLFAAPIIWAEEILIFIMIWTVFIGAVLVSYDGQHLKMDFFSIKLPSPWKEVVNFLAVVTLLLVCALVISQSFRVVGMMQNAGQRSIVAEIPMVIPHLAVLLGFILIFLAVAVRFRAHVSGTASRESEGQARDSGKDAPAAADDT